jgi:hypothetical protein
MGFRYRVIDAIGERPHARVERTPKCKYLPWPHYWAGELQVQTRPFAGYKVMRARWRLTPGVLHGEHHLGCARLVARR